MLAILLQYPEESSNISEKSFTGLIMVADYRMDGNGIVTSFCCDTSQCVSQCSPTTVESEVSVSRRPVLVRPRVTIPAGGRFLALSDQRRRTTTVPQIVSCHVTASDTRICATTSRRALHNRRLYARRPGVCVPLNL